MQTCGNVFWRRMGMKLILGEYDDYWDIKEGKYKESICIGNHIVVDMDVNDEIIGIEYLWKNRIDKD